MIACIELPITGGFADAVRTHRHELSACPDIKLDDMVKPIGLREPKPFKSFLVSSLASLRDTGEMGADAFTTPAARWLEATGLIQPVSFEMDHPWKGTVTYRLTPRAIEFLNEHEAPESWL